MKFPIGTPVLATPRTKDCAAKHAFQGRVTDYIDACRLYIVEDQDSDFFTMEEHELEEIKD